MEDVKDIKEKAYKDYQAGMKYKDIATKYNVSLSAVKSWVSRDWKKLQTKVKKVATEEKKLQPEITPSWPEMEHEYITDIARKPCTLKDLSQKYAIAYGAVRSYAASNNWNEKRKSFKHSTSTKAAEKTTELLSQKIAEARERHFKISDKVIDEIEKSLANEELYTYVEVLRTGYGQGEFADSIEIQTTAVLNDKKLVNIVNALEKIQKIQRAALRETTPMDEHKMRIDSDRLALEKQKANADENANKPIEIIIGKANGKENNGKAD